MLLPTLYVPEMCTCNSLAIEYYCCNWEVMYQSMQVQYPLGLHGLIETESFIAVSEEQTVLIVKTMKLSYTSEKYLHFITSHFTSVLAAQSPHVTFLLW